MARLNSDSSATVTHEVTREAIRVVVSDNLAVSVQRLCAEHYCVSFVQPSSN